MEVYLSLFFGGKQRSTSAPGNLSITKATYNWHQFFIDARFFL
jgi:hypothetical protein